MPRELKMPTKYSADLETLNDGLESVKLFISTTSTPPKHVNECCWELLGWKIRHAWVVHIFCLIKTMHLSCQVLASVCVLISVWFILCACGISKCEEKNKRTSFKKFTEWKKNCESLEEARLRTTPCRIESLVYWIELLIEFVVKLTYYKLIPKFRE